MSFWIPEISESNWAWTCYKNYRTRKKNYRPFSWRAIAKFSLKNFFFWYCWKGDTFSQQVIYVLIFKGTCNLKVSEVAQQQEKSFQNSTLELHDKNFFFLSYRYRVAMVNPKRIWSGSIWVLRLYGNDDRYCCFSCHVRKKGLKISMHNIASV